MRVENLPRAAQGIDAKRAREFFEKDLRDRLMEEHEGCAVLIDGRSLDYEVQSRRETRVAARTRLLERQPNARMIIEHLVSDDFAYTAPSGFVIDS